MRRGWTKSWLCTSASLALLLAAVAVAEARQEPPQKDREEKAKHEYELTLAGLRPGRDAWAAAQKRYKVKYLANDGAASDAKSEKTKEWRDSCTGRSLTLALDDKSTVQVITVSSFVTKDGKCDDRRFDALDMKEWATGRGLRLGDARNRITELYGEPNSSGPSVKGDRELEFLYYAFDWAGPEVPQVMEIYCDRETGRVVEITLAFPSL